jgi:hypothetical protein
MIRKRIGVLAGIAVIAAAGLAVGIAVASGPGSQSSAADGCGCCSGLDGGCGLLGGISGGVWRGGRQWPRHGRGGGVFWHWPVSGGGE